MILLLPGTRSHQLYISIIWFSLWFGLTIKLHVVTSFSVAGSSTSDAALLLIFMSTIDYLPLELRVQACHRKGSAPLSQRDHGHGHPLTGSCDPNKLNMATVRLQKSSLEGIVNIVYRVSFRPPEILVRRVHPSKGLSMELPCTPTRIALCRGEVDGFQRDLSPAMSAAHSVGIC